jgi:DnaJ like chaperone protein
MAWWGKLLGGTFGFVLGGPLGAVLGAAMGHQFDAGLKGLGRSPGFVPGAQERTQMAFFTATFSVMGHLAKADGQVSEREIALANHLMREMRLNPEQRAAAIKLFNQGKKADFPLDDVLGQFKSECHRRTTLIRMFLEIQVQAALADGRVHDAENRVLYHVADVLGFSHEELGRLVDFVYGAATGQRPDHRVHSLEDAYKLLGVDAKTSDDDVKKAYRRLMNQHHPDKLVARGMPEEMVKLATEKTQEIRSAYEQIRDYRKSRH